MDKIAAKRSDALTTRFEIAVEDGKQELVDSLIEEFQNV